MVPVGPHLLSHSPLCPPSTPPPGQLACTAATVSPPEHPLSHVEYSEPPQDRLGWLVRFWSGLASRTEPTINRGTAVASSGPEVAEVHDSRDLRRPTVSELGKDITRKTGTTKSKWPETFAERVAAI